MVVRVQLVITVLLALTHFSISRRKEFSIGEICDNLADYFNLINPILNIKIELDFKNSGRFLHNKGSIVFSPEFVINDCKAHKGRDSKIFMIASVVNSFLVKFSGRSWVYIENGMLNITAKCELITSPRHLNENIKEVRFTSVNLAHIEKARVNNKYLDKWSMKPLRDLISYSLSDYASKKVYLLRPEDQVSESLAIAAFNSAFQYYMYRL